MFFFLLVALATLIDASLIHNAGFFPGVSVIICQAVFLIILFYSSQKSVYNDIEIHVPHSWKHSLFLTGLSLILASWFAFFTNGFFAFVFFVLLFCIDLLLLILVRNPLQKLTWIPLDDLRVVPYILETILDKMGTGGGYLMDRTRQIVAGRKQGGVVLKALWALLLLCVIIIPLLISSDMVFQKLFTDFFDSVFFGGNIFDVFTRIFSIGGVFLILITLHRAFTETPYHPHPRTIIIFKIDKIYNYIVLGGLNLIYLLFIALQVRYTWFVDQTTFSTLGISYGEYIHTGFYQLLFIALINYIIYQYFFRKTHEKGQKGIRTNLIFLILLTLAIAGSATLRIILYIEAYDMTVLRFFVIYILGGIAFLFVLNLLNLIRESRIYQKIFALSVLLSFVTLGFLSIEKYIAQYNITHAHEGYYDIEYILSMSNDAFDEKVQALAQQRIIDQQNLQNVNTLSSTPTEEDTPGLSYVEATPVVNPIPPSEIPLYYWNLTTLRVTEYIKKHPEEREYLSQRW